VLKEKVRKLVGERVGKAPVGVDWIEDDEARRIHQHGSRREAAVVDDRQLVDRGSCGSLLHKVGNGDDRDAVLRGECAGIEPVVSTEIQFGANSICKAVCCRRESSAQHRSCTLSR
jgi:hypothetical protein